MATSTRLNIEKEKQHRNGKIIMAILQPKTLKQCMREKCRYNSCLLKNVQPRSSFFGAKLKGDHQTRKMVRSKTANSQTEIPIPQNMQTANDGNVGDASQHLNAEL